MQSRAGRSPSIGTLMLQPAADSFHFRRMHGESSFLCTLPASRYRYVASSLRAIIIISACVNKLILNRSTSSPARLYIGWWRHRVCGHDTIACWTRCWPDKITWNNMCSKMATIDRVIQINLNQFKKMSVWLLTYQQNICKRYYSDKHSQSFTYMMTSEMNWQRHWTKLRHCRPM